VIYGLQEGSPEEENSVGTRFDSSARGVFIIVSRSHGLPSIFTRL
jgi:hypothetical protein